MSRGTIVVLILTLLGAVLAAPAFGQSEQQSIKLEKGWNLIWLSVQPDPDDPATVLAGVDWEGIWSFVAGTASGSKGQWVSSLKSQPEFVNTLKHLQGDRGYLVRMATGGTVNIQGTPIKRTGTFAANSSTLFGIHLPAGQGPTFSDYFSFAGASGKIVSIFKLTGNVFSPVSPLSTIESDVSYWITFSRDVTYTGPFGVSAPSSGYQFGKRGYVDRITVEVQAASTVQTLAVKAVSAAAPPPGKPSDAGAGDASWMEYELVTPATDTEAQKHEWKPLTGGAIITIASGQTRGQLVIRANRRGRTPATIQGTNSLYQAMIQISDAKGNTRTFAAGMEVPEYYGVYVGQARLNRVATPSTATPPATLAPAEPMTLSLILSLASPAEGGAMQLLDQKALNTLRDGRKLAFRYNAILFPRPVALTGSITGNGAAGTLTGEFTLAADDPLNPYRHRYNPEHRTGFAVTRQITLEFSPDDTNPVNQALGLADSAGNNELTGTYTEVIRGLSLEPITVSGSFKLIRLTEATKWEPTAQ